MNVNLVKKKETFASDSYGRSYSLWCHMSEIYEGKIKIIMVFCVNIYIKERLRKP